jgi:hypothetical protein
MVIVRFNEWDPFIEELTARPPEDRLVRLTFSLRYDRQNSAHLTLVAGYLERSTIVEFVQYLGFQPADRRNQRSDEIRKLLEERREALDKLGFTVKSGRYHVPPTLQH